MAMQFKRGTEPVTLHNGQPFLKKLDDGGIDLLFGDESGESKISLTKSILKNIVIEEGSIHPLEDTTFTDIGTINYPFGRLVCRNIGDEDYPVVTTLTTYLGMSGNNKVSTAYISNLGTELEPTNKAYISTASISNLTGNAATFSTGVSTKMLGGPTNPVGTGYFTDIGSSSKHVDQIYADYIYASQIGSFSETTYIVANSIYCNQSVDTWDTVRYMRNMDDYRLPLSLIQSGKELPDNTSMVYRDGDIFVVY